MRCQRDRDAPWVGDMVVLRRSRSQCYRTAPSAGVVQSATLNVVLAAASSRGGGKRRQAAAVQSGWRRCRRRVRGGAPSDDHRRPSTPVDGG